MTDRIPTAPLEGTPYLIGDDRRSIARFENAVRRSSRTRGQAAAVQAQIANRAAGLLEPLRAILREELVAESNRIEGYDWEPSAVRAVAQAHDELLRAPVHAFVRGIEDDPRVYQALGLYRAHMLADEWADSGDRPREFEIRQLHALITAGESFAGKYKTATNRIGGSEHLTTPPIDVPRAMDELATWWHLCSSDPVLDATVVHAWLTHVHPFEDGNGRMARLLANLTLVQSGYPPLIISSSADRGQYYDALARSDDGDILPLYDLFSIVVRRTTRVMGTPEYVDDLLQDRLLSSSVQALELWKTVFAEFDRRMTEALEARGWTLTSMGLPDSRSFDLLRQRSADGNSWYLKLRHEELREEFLLWFGYTGDQLAVGRPIEAMFPSIYVSIPDNDPTSIHPFRWARDVHGLPSELLISPLGSKLVQLRRGSSVESLTLNEAADALCKIFSDCSWDSARTW